MRSCSWQGLSGLGGGHPFRARRVQRHEGWREILVPRKEDLTLAYARQRAARALRVLLE